MAVGELLARDRGAAMRALGDIAYVSCVMADSAKLDATQVADAMRPAAPAPDAPGEKAAAKAGARPRTKVRRRGPTKTKKKAKP